MRDAKHPDDGADGRGGARRCVATSPRRQDEDEGAGAPRKRAYPVHP